ncbi:MAG: flagellar hook-associated protein FlgL [Thiobacillus sp.]|nr:flagellar hook-associated protein FlgL [bacterium]MDP2028113.1 flagellar hook-associated protein FlgL [Thiobacillus sp.]
MRISTQMQFETGANRMGDLQSRLLKTQEQIGSGRRILSPSDDPVAATRVLDITQTQTINTQYGVNRQYAKNTLGLVDGTLAGVTALMQDVKDTITAAGNGTLTDSMRASQASELNGRLQQLLGYANTRDAMGNYLFSGFQSNTPAFVQTATGATYQGDLGLQKLQVDSTRQMAISSPGATVFQSGGQDVFATLTDLVALLNTPGTAGLTAGLATANAGMDTALQNVLTVRASVGASLQELDTLDSVGEDRNLQYSKVLSELQDLDYTQAITQLSMQQMTLEAAQKSFVKSSELSLFNFI